MIGAGRRGSIRRPGRFAAGAFYTRRMEIACSKAASLAPASASSPTYLLGPQQRANGQTSANLRTNGPAPREGAFPQAPHQRPGRRARATRRRRSNAGCRLSGMWRTSTLPERVARKCPLETSKVIKVCCRRDLWDFPNSLLSAVGPVHGGRDANIFLHCTSRDWVSRDAKDSLRGESVFGKGRSNV